MGLKVCFIDVTHWHAPPYYKTLHQLVGVAALSARNPRVSCNRLSANCVTLTDKPRSSATR